MKYQHCPGSLWLRSLVREQHHQAVSKIYLTPFVGRITINDLEQMGGGGSKRFPSQTQGLFSVESSLSHADMNSLWNTARLLKNKPRITLQRWLEELWVFNQVPPQQGLPDFSDFDGSMRMFLDKPQDQQEAILDAVSALLDAEEHAIRMARYTERPVMAPLSILREEKKYLTQGSRAHATFVTHRKHKDEAGEAAYKIFEKMSEVVKEGEWAEEAEGSIAVPDFGGIDPLNLIFIVTSAEEADLVENAEVSAQEFVLEKFGITGC